MERGDPRPDVADGHVPGRGDLVRDHERLGHRLAALELRGRLARTEGRDPGLAQAIGEPVDERRLGTDHDQIDALAPTQPDQIGVGDAVGDRRDRVAARAGDHAVALTDAAPRERVLAASRSNNQYRAHAVVLAG